MKKYLINQRSEIPGTCFNRFVKLFILFIIYIFNFNFAEAQDDYPCSNCMLNVGATTTTGYIRPTFDKSFPSPVIISPADTFVQVNNLQCRATVGLDTPLIAQNSICNIPVNNISNNAPQYFSLGTTIVQWKFTNIYNRSTFVNQNVIIINNLQATINHVDPACFGSNSGNAHVNVTGGSQPYSYLWNNSQVNSTDTSIGAGNYYVTVTDQNGCTVNDSVTLNDPGQLMISASVISNVSSCGGSDGSASASVSGGTSPVQITWSDNQNGPTAFNLTAGIYTATATDAKGCSASDSVLITQGNPEICYNGIDDNCDGNIDEGCLITLNLKVFIEGFYTGNGMMNATVDPVNYPNLCDTITVELHNSLSPYQSIFSDKKTIDIYGDGLFSFPETIFNQSFYIVIRHRNALETWSYNPVLFNSPVTNYDFSLSSNMAFGNNQTSLNDGRFAIWSGDISDADLGVGYQDGVVESQDYSDMENAVYYTMVGYNTEDITGDGIVESEDYSLMENNVYFTVFAIRP